MDNWIGPSTCNKLLFTKHHGYEAFIFSNLSCCSTKGQKCIYMQIEDLNKRTEISLTRQYCYYLKGKCNTMRFKLCDNIIQKVTITWFLKFSNDAYKYLQMISYY